MAETIFSVFSCIICIISFVIAMMIRKRKIPPISTEYITSNLNIKEKLKNDSREINFISNVFFIISISFFIVFLMFVLPEIKALKFLAYLMFGILLVYAIYNSIAHENRKAKKQES